MDNELGLTRQQQSATDEAFLRDTDNLPSGEDWPGERLCRELQDRCALLKLQDEVAASTAAFERDWVRPLVEHGYDLQTALRLLTDALFKKPN